MTRVIVLLAALAFAGCQGGAARPLRTTFPAYGGLFQLTTEPLTHDFDRTPVGLDHSDGIWSGVKQLQYRGFRVLWDDNSIGSLAKEAGLDEVYYADIQTLSILNVYTQYKVRVYGKQRALPPAAPAP